MRNLFFLFFISVVVVSCDDTEFNTPIIQGELDNQFFRSKAQAAIDSDGMLIIKGSEQDVITLSVNGTSTGTYTIAPNSGTRATFLRDGELFITSGPDTGGEVVIERISEAGVSGSFFFRARLNGVGRMINFNRGVFFEIPFFLNEIDLPLPEEPEGE